MLGLTADFTTATSLRVSSLAACGYYWRRQEVRRESVEVLFALAVQFRQRLKTFLFTKSYPDVIF